MMHIFACILFPLLLMAAFIDGVVATVEDQVITISDIRKLQTDISKQGLVDPNILVGKSSDAIKADKKVALEVLIRDRVLNIAVQNLKLEASDEVLEKEISNVAKRNQLTRDSFAAALAQQGMTLDQYKKFLKKSIERQSLTEQEILSKIKISDEEISDAYLKTSKNAEKTSFEYTLSQIFISRSTRGDSAETSATEVYKRLGAGESFEGLASQASDDKTTREVGGLLGKFKLNELNTQFSSAIKSLKKGQYTKIIKTKEGYHIFKVVDQKIIPNPDYLSQRSKISEMLTKKLFEETLERWFQDQIAQTNIQKNEIAETL